MKGPLSQLRAGWASAPSFLPPNPTRAKWAEGPMGPSLPSSSGLRLLPGSETRATTGSLPTCD